MKPKICSFGGIRPAYVHILFPECVDRCVMRGSRARGVCMNGGGGTPEKQKQKEITQKFTLTGNIVSVWSHPLGDPSLIWRLHDQ